MKKADQNNPVPKNKYDKMPLFHGLPETIWNKNYLYIKFINPDTLSKTLSNYEKEKEFQDPI